MCQKIFWIAAGLLFLIGTAGLPVTRAQEQATQAPLSDWSIYEDEIWITLMDEPETHFQKADESFMKKDYQASATEIHKGAAFMKLEATRSKAEGKDALMDSADELDKLADALGKGAVTSEKDLKDAFARADYALANHHYIKSSEAWAKNDTKKAGEDLKASTTYVERAWKWSGQKIDTGSDAAVKGLHTLYGKTKSGAKWTAEEGGKGIQDLGNEVSKLGKVIQPKKK